MKREGNGMEKTQRRRKRRYGDMRRSGDAVSANEGWGE